MAVSYWGAPFAKEAQTQDYLFTDRWPTIDLNPEDWREDELPADMPDLRGVDSGLQRPVSEE